MGVCAVRRGGEGGEAGRRGMRGEGAEWVKLVYELLYSEVLEPLDGSRSPSQGSDGCSAHRCSLDAA